MSTIIVNTPHNRLTGTEGDDIIEGNGLIANFINGRGGDDFINPGIRNPLTSGDSILKLYGDNHNSYEYDSIGNDYMAIGRNINAIGGAGNDIYSFHGGAGLSRLIDFNTGQNTGERGGLGRMFQDILIIDGSNGLDVVDEEFRFFETEKHNGNMKVSVTGLGLEGSSTNPVTDGQHVFIAENVTVNRGIESLIDPSDGILFNFCYNPALFDSALDALQYKVDKHMEATVVEDQKEVLSWLNPLDFNDVGLF